MSEVVIKKRDDTGYCGGCSKRMAEILRGKQHQQQVCLSKHKEMSAPIKHLTVNRQSRPSLNRKRPLSPLN